MEFRNQTLRAIPGHFAAWGRKIHVKLCSFPKASQVILTPEANISQEPLLFPSSKNTII